MANTNPGANLGKFLHPKGGMKEGSRADNRKDKAAAKKTGVAAKAYEQSAADRDAKKRKAAPKPKASAGKAPRADFALSGGRFPLNTAGRRKVADKDATVARKAGTISAAEQAKVKRAVAAKRKKG
jgi:hypothetical protein